MGSSETRTKAVRTVMRELLKQKTTKHSGIWFINHYNYYRTQIITK